MIPLINLLMGIEFALNYKLDLNIGGLNIGIGKGYVKRNQEKEILLFMNDDSIKIFSNDSIYSENGKIYSIDSLGVDPLTAFYGFLDKVQEEEDINESLELKIDGEIRKIDINKRDDVYWISGKPSIFKDVREIGMSLKEFPYINYKLPEKLIFKKGFITIIARLEEIKKFSFK